MFKKICLVGGLLLSLFSKSQTHSALPGNKMAWWKEAKFGMFIHWGLYSLPAGTWQGKQMNRAYGSEWLLNILRVPIADYKQLATQFNPTQFDAERIVITAKAAGMKYIVFTAKHCDGFAMFASANPFNIVDATPYKKDVVKMMADACKKHHMPFGVYYSQAQDWLHPGGGAYEKKWDRAQEGSFSQFIEKVSLPQVKEIVAAYQPKFIWFDTPAEMTPALAKKFTDYLAAYPNLLFNDRLGGGVPGDWSTPEQYIPEAGMPGKNWESCMTINGTWGYNANDHQWKPTETLIRNLIDIASKGGNYLLNIGPDATGTVPAPSVERLLAMGKWLKVNGEAIYGTAASPFAEVKWGKITQKAVGGSTKLYLHVYRHPQNEPLVLSGLTNRIIKAYPLAQPNQKIPLRKQAADVLLNVSSVTPTDYATVVVVEIEGKPEVVQAPTIHATATSFIHQLPLTIKAKGEVHYTTDGSLPNAASPVAKDSLWLLPNTSFVLKAQVFEQQKPVSGIAEQPFTKVTPLQPVIKQKQGLQYAYYEGEWNQLPDFSTMKALHSGVAETIGTEMKKREKQFGMVFSGYLKITQTNIYTWFLSSDDGSCLLIDDQVVIANDGLHGMEDKTVELPLAEGLHTFKLCYFQQEGGSGLQLHWQPLGAARSAIDKQYFIH